MGLKNAALRQNPTPLRVWLHKQSPPTRAAIFIACGGRLVCEQDALDTLKGVVIQTKP